MAQPPTSQTNESATGGKYRTPSGMRNVRVLVSEATFVWLHDMATKSRMRFQPYLRRVLGQARPFEFPPSELTPTFASGKPIPEPGDEDTGG